MHSKVTRLQEAASVWCYRALRYSPQSLPGVLRFWCRMTVRTSPWHAGMGALWGMEAYELLRLLSDNDEVGV